MWDPSVCETWGMWDSVSVGDLGAEKGSKHRKCFLGFLICESFQEKMVSETVRNKNVFRIKYRIKSPLICI